MFSKIDTLLDKIANFNPKSKKEIDDFRVFLFGKKGEITLLFDKFKNLPVEEKKILGKKINHVKFFGQNKIEGFKGLFDKVEESVLFDMSKPVSQQKTGGKHPISLVKKEVIDIFSGIGFCVSDGPEIEDDWHNFSALNLPKNHPARDMQDTFFIQTNPDILLRTHTSSVQVRHMEKNEPPIRTISPGRVYRNESVSSRSHCIFHQVEGLYINKGVGFSDLKQTLFYFAKKMFGKKTKLRLRPSYFPFTEPSAEVDIYWGLKTEIDRRITKGTGWLEILGCGMVDPNVLKNCGIDEKKYSGFAFGMGIERMAMLKYGVGDLRLFFENDIRFLKQFSVL